jgi:hypothetical protein
VQFEGVQSDLAMNGNTLTGRYLSHRRALANAARNSKPPSLIVESSSLLPCSYTG